MDILIKAKERVNKIKEKGTKLITAVGGRIEGVEALSEDEAVRIRRRAGYCIFCALSGFLFAGTSAAFESYPFALALLCCAGHSGAFFVYAGAIAGALASSGAAFAHLLIYTLALICRILLSPKSDVKGRRIFEEEPKIRVLICLACSFLLGIYSFVDKLQSSGIDGLLSLLFVIVCAPVLTLLFICSLGDKGNSALKEAGLCALLFVFIYSLTKHTFFGYSFAASVSFLIILTISNAYGTLKGAICGLVCGVASAVSPVTFTVAGFAAGAFRVFGVVPGVFVSLATAIGCAAYLDGLSSVFMLAGDMIFAALIYIPLYKTGLFSKLILSNDEQMTSVISDAMSEEKHREGERKKFASLSRAFDDLSKVFVKLSANLRSPGLYELHELCDDVFDRYCRKCSLVSFCWQRNFDETNEGINLVAESMRNKGFLEKGDLPEFLAKRCRNIEKILLDINRGCADMVEDAIKKDKTELFALDYEAISELLRESVGNDGDYILDSDLQNKAAKIIRGLGISSMAYGAWGKRAKTILASGVEIGSIAVTSDEIRRSLENGTGLRLSEPEFNFSGEFVSMSLTSRKSYKIKTAFSYFCAKGEEISGDKSSSFESVNNYAYVTLCDGMGSGPDAASVSEISELFIEKMLSAGNCLPVTLKLLSNFLRARSDEYHCTADILEFDLINARASFIKCGAPPSYVLRNSNIFKIEARSMPLGLTKEINAEKVEMQLAENDTVILVSDGVAPDLEEALWLPDLLLSCKDMPIKDIADTVAKRAKAESDSADDITVCVIKISGIEE